jgi:hypothetical protein
MSRFLTVVLLGSTAFAQAVPSSFSAGGSLPPTAASDPSPAEETANPGNRISPLPELLPQPQGKPTLIGGTIARIDRVRDGMSVKIFGGGSTHILFDSRTHIFRDGVAASAGALQNGERVYVDTMLAGTSIFARNIRIVTQGSAAQTMGQVTSYDARTGELLLSDAISPQTVKVHIASTTMISREGQTASSSELLSGTLVSVAFLPDEGGQSVARQVSILAKPGSTFVFVGRVVHLDLHLGLMVVVDPRDQKSYEIAFDPSVIQVSDNVREGATVEATTAFDGRRYMASTIRVDSSSKP